MPVRALTLAVIALCSACAELAVDEPVSQVQQNFGGCAEWACGTNSPEVANLGFWDMAIPTQAGTLGLPNAAGMQLYVFVRETSPSWSLYMPRVVSGKLIATPVSSNVAPNDVKLSGADLVGGYLMIWTPTGWVKLWIKATSQVASWAQPVGTLRDHPRVALETYLIEWSDLSGEVRKNICNRPGERDDTGMNGPLAYHTLLFEGDRIDAAKKRVYGVDTTWFNFGCAGSALAKMALTGHTEASRLAHTFNTTLGERQTMLKMLTGDYCGDGTPFTVAGQPLNWADDRGTMKMTALLANPARPVLREARWTPTGPACLDKPRVDVHWTPLGEATFGLSPSVYDQAAQHCPASMPPVCDGAQLDMQGYHLMTATEPLGPPP